MSEKGTVKHVAQVRELRLAVSSDTPFDDLVAMLKHALTVPELPGVKGCRPCLSGLDRFVVEELVQQRVR